MRKHQTGQAMLEFFVAASFVLVPMLFMITYLGKAGDVQHRAYESARYAVWEKAKSNKSDIEIQSETNKRILYGLHTEFDSSEDRLANNNESSDVDNLYRHTSDAGVYGDFLVKDNNTFVAGESRNEQPAGTAHRLRSSTLNSGLVGYDLQENGMLTASVEFETVPSKYFDMPDPIKPSAKNVMYIEQWRQISNARVVDAMQGVVFGKRAFDNPVFDVITTAAAFIGFKEFDEFEPGFVRPDVVPCSRVVGGGSNREIACR